MSAIKIFGPLFTVLILSSTIAGAASTLKDSDELKSYKVVSSHTPTNILTITHQAIDYSSDYFADDCYDVPTCVSSCRKSTSCTAFMQTSLKVCEDTQRKILEKVVQFDPSIHLQVKAGAITQSVMLNKGYSQHWCNIDVTLPKEADLHFIKNLEMFDAAKEETEKLTRFCQERWTDITQQADFISVADSQYSRTPEVKFVSGIFGVLTFNRCTLEYFSIDRKH